MKDVGLYYSYAARFEYSSLKELSLSLVYFTNSSEAPQERECVEKKQSAEKEPVVKSNR